VVERKRWGREIRVKQRKTKKRIHLAYKEYFNSFCVPHTHNGSERGREGIKYMKTLKKLEFYDISFSFKKYE
jgi:hypothetical protein